MSRIGRVFTVGGLLGELAASSCCTVPLVLVSLGIGGAWMGNLTALAPYHLGIVVVTVGLLGAGYYLVYRNSRDDCADDKVCAQPVSQRMTKIGLWLATVLGAVAFVFPYVVAAVAST